MNFSRPLLSGAGCLPWGKLAKLESGARVLARLPWASQMSEALRMQEEETQGGGVLSHAVLPPPAINNSVPLPIKYS